MKRPAGAVEQEVKRPRRDITMADIESLPFELMFQLLVQSLTTLPDRMPVRSYTHHRALALIASDR